MDGETNTKPDAAEAEAAPVKRFTERTFTLETPVDAHGEKVSKLTFRVPSGKDYIEAGYPVKIDFETGDVELNERKMHAMMSRLAAVPPSTIAALKGNDWATCAWGIASFFMPDKQVMTQS